MCSHCLLSAAPSADSPSLIPQTGSPLADALLYYGPLGLILFLIIMGWLVPKPGLERLKDDRDDWKAAFEEERTSHRLTRQALVQANSTAEAALESSTTVAMMLNHLGHRAGDVTQPIRRIDDGGAG